MRVSADTKTCGIPLYLSPTGGLCLPSGKHAIRLTYYQTIVNKKMTKNELFFGHSNLDWRIRKLGGVLGW